MRTLLLLSLLSLPALAQRPPPAPPAPAPAPMPPMPPHPPGRLLRSPGIPPALAQKLGLSAEVQRKVRELGFEANDAVIPLEADLKRAQLDLERTLSQPQIEDATVMQKLDAISRAELAVRKNRMGLMLRIRKLVGPETWDKLQSALDFDDDGDVVEERVMGEGGGQRREVRVIKRNGHTEVHETNE